jgi:hypothetical protein
MSARSGLITLEVDLRTRSALKLINVSDTQQMPTYKELIGIPPQCPDPKAEVITYANARPTAVMTCLSDNSGNSLQTALTPDNYRCETLFVSPDVDRLRPNTDYELVGFNYADPKTQRAIFWSHKAEPVVPPMELFELTSELGDKLKIFQPDYAAPNGVWNKLVDVAEDLSSSVTLIRGRADLHLAYRTVWHSCLAFTFRGAIYKRGWIEAIVIGDTRCGKSAAFQAMAEMYDLGVMVDCKNLPPVSWALRSNRSSMATGWSFLAYTPRTMGGWFALMSSTTIETNRSSASCRPPGRAALPISPRRDRPPSQRVCALSG